MNDWCGGVEDGQRSVESSEAGLWLWRGRGWHLAEAGDHHEEVMEPCGGRPRQHRETTGHSAWGVAADQSSSHSQCHHGWNAPMIRTITCNYSSHYSTCLHTLESDLTTICRLASSRKGTTNLKSIRYVKSLCILCWFYFKMTCDLLVKKLQHHPDSKNVFCLFTAWQRDITPINK